MKRTFLFVLIVTSFAIAHQASAQTTPHRKNTSSKSAKKQESQAKSSNSLAESAHGWSYIKGEWIHPDGYKFVKGQVLRTTAKTGKVAPEPPGKLALENAQKLTPKTVTPPAKTAAEQAAETRRRNLTPGPTHQTGTNL